MTDNPELEAARDRLRAAVAPILHRCGYADNEWSLHVPWRGEGKLLAVLRASPRLPDEEDQRNEAPDHVVHAQARAETVELLEAELLASLQAALREGVTSIERHAELLTATRTAFQGALTLLAPRCADPRPPETRGLMAKYLVTRPGSMEPIGSACFVLRPGHDPYSDAAAAASPELIRDMRSRGLEVRKFLRWEGGGRSVDDPDPTPVFSEPLPDAVALIFGIGPEEPVTFGHDYQEALPPGALANHWTSIALLAYAQACAADLPELAADLRRLCTPVST